MKLKELLPYIKETEIISIFANHRIHTNYYEKLYYCKRRERQNCFNWIEENNVFGVYGEDTLKEARECFNEREVINIHAETYVLEIELKDEC